MTDKKRKCITSDTKTHALPPYFFMSRQCLKNETGATPSQAIPNLSNCGYRYVGLYFKPRGFQEIILMRGVVNVL